MSDYREMLERAPLPQESAERADGDDVVDAILDHREFRSVLVRYLNGEVGSGRVIYEIELIAAHVRELQAECPEDAA